MQIRNQQVNAEEVMLFRDRFGFLPQALETIARDQSVIMIAVARLLEMQGDEADSILANELKHRSMTEGLN